MHPAFQPNQTTHLSTNTFTLISCGLARVCDICPSLPTISACPNPTWASTTRSKGATSYRTPSPFPPLRSSFSEPQHPTFIAVLWARVLVPWLHWEEVTVAFIFPRPTRAVPLPRLASVLSVWTTKDHWVLGGQRWALLFKHLTESTGNYILHKRIWGCK